MDTPEVTPQSLAPLDTFLGLPCDAFVSRSVATYLSQRRVTHMRELAALGPDELRGVPGIGPTVIPELDALFRARTGRSWRDVCDLIRSHRGEAPAVRRTDPSSWDDFRDAFPSELHGFPVERIDLPARVRNRCEDWRIATVGDLLACSEYELIRRNQLGRVTMRETRTVLAALCTILDGIRVEDLTARFATSDAIATEIALRAAERVGNWLALLRARLDEMSSAERIVILQRSGLGGDRATLEHVASLLGVSRERVRQLETLALAAVGRHWGMLALRERLCLAMRGGARTLSDLASEPFFAGTDERATAFGYVVEHLFGDVARVVHVGGRIVIAPTTPRD